MLNYNIKGVVSLNTNCVALVVDYRHCKVNSETKHTQVDADDLISIPCPHKKMTLKQLMNGCVIHVTIRSCPSIVHSD
jgi:hypothetical protein